jgi:hypothetical protein
LSGTSSPVRAFTRPRRGRRHRSLGRLCGDLPQLRQRACDQQGDPARFSELQKSLDTGTHALLDALRHCSISERSFRQSQVDAAVRFRGKVFGDEYASLLSKAADVASQSERKAAAAVRA